MVAVGCNGDESSSTPTATVSATPTSVTADVDKCPTNSPNDPCITAQAKTAGFTAFMVNGKLVGGPAEQWWPLQRADGNFVPNSYKMVGMRQNDKGSLPGYEMHVPEGMILDTWLDGPEFNNRKTAARIYGPANINASYRVAEATLYAAPSDFVKDLAGMWARLTDKYECGDFVKAGTTPPVATSPHDCHVAGGSTSMASNGGNTGSCDPNRDLGGSWTSKGGNAWGLNGQATVTGNSRYVVHTPGYPGDPGLPAGKSENTAAATAYCQ